MKQLLKPQCRKTLTLLFLALLPGYITLYAQPTGGSSPVTATNNDHRILTNVASSATDVEVINCDMYVDMSTSTTPSGNYVSVIVWDEYDVANNQWNVYAGAWDNASNTFLLIDGGPATGPVCTDCRHPDVAIGDGPNPQQGSVYVGIVYENTSTSEVEYTEYEVNNLFGYGGGLAPPASASSIGGTSFNADPTHPAQNPHIDALPKWQSSAYYSAGGLNTSYQPLRNFALTWTEDDGSSNDEIWLMKGIFFTSGPVNNAELVDNGTMSDVGCTHSSNTNDYAYVSYIDAGGDLVMEQFDITTPTSISGSGGTSLITSSTISSYPRIDAPNVVDASAPPTILWGITTTLYNSGTGNNEAWFSDNLGNTDFGTAAPYNTGSGAEAFYPCTAMGPGPHDYNGNGGAFGNKYFIHASHLSDYNTGTEDVVATDYDMNLITPVFGGYYQVNKIAQTIVPTPVAVTTASNSGAGYTVAWYNEDVISNTFFIHFKANTANSLSFKPGRPNSIIATDNVTYNFWPNPAAEYVSVNGLTTNATYTATDMSGRVVASGTITPTDPKINIAALSQGVYIFNFNERDVNTKLKLVKK